MSDEEDTEDCRPLVIDHGSCTIKAGFSGDDAANIVFPSIVGIPEPKGGVMIGMGGPSRCVGDEAIHKKTFSRSNYYNYEWKLKRPIQKGIITNWDDMERIWYHTFYNELRICPEEHMVLITDKYQNESNVMIQTEKMTQIAFETFNVVAINISKQSVLSMYAAGKLNGIIVDFGYQTTNIVPIYEGHVLKHAANILDIGGKDITDHLMKLLEQKRDDESKEIERKHVMDIKEKYGYIAMNYKEEMKTTEIEDIQKQYELPDGNIISCDKERFCCAEILFKPLLIDCESKGVHKLLYDTIMEFEMDILNKLSENVVLSGGGSMLVNIEKRLQNEMECLVSDINLNVIAPSNRKYSAFIGGSILSSLSDFSDFCIDKDTYDEYGPPVIHSKCF